MQHANNPLSGAVQRSPVTSSASRLIFGLALTLPLAVSAATQQISVAGQSFEIVGGEPYLVANGQRFAVEPDVVTVRFRDTVAPLARTNLFARLGTRVVRENRLGIIDLHVPEGRSTLDFLADLHASGLFEFAEANAFGEYTQLPDDTQFSSQWGPDNTGQTGGTPDADVDAPEAWDITTGDPSVIVAVLDSGTEIDHPDLECNIRVNPGEDLDGDGVVWDLDDFNGVDDDGNGLVDDVAGWDFWNGNNDPRGTFFHGTHVAGIVTACTNNGLGIAGLAGGWGPQKGAQTLAIGVGDDFPAGSILDDAILYAVDQGAQIITLSLTVSPSAAIDAALESAWDAGVFIDSSAGNSGGAIGYPATHPDVMAVGATDHNDRRASFSSFGPALEVIGPGVDIRSTQLRGGYGLSSGTSFSSPHVAGIAALYLSANPGATNEQVRSCLQSSADDQVGDPAQDTPGRDDFYGHGRVNAAAMLACGAGNACDEDGDGDYDRDDLVDIFRACVIGGGEQRQCLGQVVLKVRDCGRP